MFPRLCCIWLSAEVDVNDTKLSLSAFIEEKCRKMEGEITEIKANACKDAAEEYKGKTQMNADLFIGTNMKTGISNNYNHF